MDGKRGRVIDGKRGGYGCEGLRVGKAGVLWWVEGEGNSGERGRL